MLVSWMSLFLVVEPTGHHELQNVDGQSESLMVSYVDILSG